MIRKQDRVLTESLREVSAVFEGSVPFPKPTGEGRLALAKRGRTKVGLDAPSVLGPIPVEWLHEADTCGRQGLSVAVAIWSLLGSEDVGTILLTREALSRFDVPLSAAPRILRRMQQKGLCKYETKRGQGAVEVRLLRR